MRNQISRFRVSILRPRRWALSLALAGGAAACSGNYPLGGAAGRAERREAETATAGVAGTAGVLDAVSSRFLPAPDVTFWLDDFSNPSPYNIASVGDVDGDGFGDMMVSH